MKPLGVFLALTFFFIAAAGLSLAAGSPEQREPIKKMEVNYNKKYQCVMICKGQKPALEVLEDGLAYALDIPFALLSPFAAPVVAPILDRYDSGPDRTYCGRSAVQR